jgi:hypothetical protein
MKRLSVLTCLVVSFALLAEGHKTKDVVNGEKISSSGRPFTEEDAVLTSLAREAHDLDNLLGPLEVAKIGGGFKAQSYAKQIVQFQAAGVGACMDVFGPKASGKYKPDAKKFEFCIKSHFNDDLLMPIMKKLFPEHKATACEAKLD